MKNLILIGKARELFLNGYPERSQEFKYLLIQENSDGPIKMLLMIMSHPFEYHAEGLMSFMEEKGLSEVIVMGGGKIDFIANSKEISVRGKSYAFGTPPKEELKSFIEEAWPNAFLVDMPEYTDSKTKVYSKGEVQYKVDHP